MHDELAMMHATERLSDIFAFLPSLMVVMVVFANSK
jgi:hypothetical protein